MNLEADQKIDVGGFAAIINSRLAAEARVRRAIAFGWLCAGAAVALCLCGAGIAFALYGYSYMISVKPAADQIAKAMVEALEKAKLKTSITGTMSLAPNSELRLLPGQTLSLAEGSIVKLDPKSSVRVVGDVKMPQPSARQLQPNVMSGDQLPFTSYTIFRSVPFGSGRIETGWNFELSDTARPKSQYCSYIQDISKGAQMKDVIAINGVSQQRSGLARASFNFEGAVSNCIWFSGV